MSKFKKSFKIGAKIFTNNNSKCLVIAEAGSNHNNKIEIAKKLIDIADEAGCDAVKFQIFKANKIIHKKYAEAQKILKKYEFKKSWVNVLKKYAKKREILFGLSAFDNESLKFIIKQKVDFIKIASTEIQDFDLLEISGKSKIPLIISTGGADLNDISKSKKIVEKFHDNFCYLHCVQRYPAKNKILNLNMIKSISSKSGKLAGYSDHSESIIIPSISVGLGGRIIEKHFTFDRSSDGPDHIFALEPNELKIMVKNIRETEKSLGSNKKKAVVKNETLGLGRRLVTKKNLKKNHIIKKSDFYSQRADINGIHSMDQKKIIGLKLNKEIMKEQVLYWKYFK